MAKVWKESTDTLATYSSELSLSLDTDWLYTRIMEWSVAHLRSFPWRETDEPYKVFLAECLLKRTTSIAVLRVYTTLLEKYPDIFSLASAQNIEEDLRPIGLYRQRGKLISQAARYIVKELAGVLPSEVTELVKIPGIGEYGASAIASFAFGKDIPAVDSNALRVVKRVTGAINLDARGAKAILRKTLRGRQSRVFNLAMIDIGSLICRPTSQKCSICPLVKKCISAQDRSRADNH